MLDDEERMIRRAEGFALGFRQRVKGVGDDRDGEPAAFLQFDRVVDTPRRARTSIPQAAQDEIRLRRQLVEIFFRRALLRGDLAALDDARNPVALFEQLGETFGQKIRVGFAVVEQTDDFAAKIGKGRHGRDPPGRCLRPSFRTENQHLRSSSIRRNPTGYNNLKNYNP
jgi:hypothetical protein